MQLIRLDASISSDLDWKISKEKGLFFLDFGLADFDPFDEGKFQAHKLALEEFVRHFPRVKKVILARTDGILQNAQIFSDYLHRLASVLPEDITPYVLCDIAQNQKIEEVILPLCKRRFNHIQLLFSEKRIPIEGDESIIVSLPQDDKYDLKIFGALFAQLTHFKCIPEELLNEYWDGVDVLIVEPNSLGETGRRMLLGFEAAGGKILYVDPEKIRAKSLDLALLSE